MHVDQLIADMKEDGWEGRPLLVIERETGYLAWTGSHRLSAAIEAGLSLVPCYVIKEEELINHGFDAEHGHVTDYERPAILKKIGDKEALHLMWQENRT